MKPLREQQAQKTKEKTYKVRSEYAADFIKELENSSELQRLIIESAKAGLSKAIVIPNKPINIEGLPASKALIKKLENEGYKTEWVEQVLEAKDKKNILGEDIIYRALHIRW